MSAHIQRSRVSRGKQICFQEAREEVQTGIDQFTERISNCKGTRAIFQNGKVMLSSVREKICTLALKNKIKCCSVKSIFSEHEVKKNNFP